VVRTVGECWPNEDDGGKQHQKLVNSGPSGTEQLACAEEDHVTNKQYSST